MIKSMPKVIVLESVYVCMWPLVNGCDSLSTKYIVHLASVTVFKIVSCLPKLQHIILNVMLYQLVVIL